MRAVLAYTTRGMRTGIEKSDAVLIRQFNEWRYGEYEHQCEEIDSLRELNYHPYNRSYEEVWCKAEEFINHAKTAFGREFFKRIAEKYYNKTIYG